MKEKFLILEIAPGGTTGLFLSVDEDRNIILEKIKHDVDIKKFFAFVNAPLRSVSQKAWEGEYIFKARRKVIAAADPSLATTIPIPLDLTREEGTKEKEKIMLAELENMIAQGMAKIFNGCRVEAAQRLSVHELDTILVSAKAKHFRVDGKPVASPAGHPGKKISLLLELTFTTRAIFEDLKQFFNSPEEFFFAEAPQARLTALARVRKLPISLLVANGDAASLYVFENPKDDYAVLYRENLNWSFSAFAKLIMDELGVSEAVAKRLYKKYVSGDMSEAVARALKKTIQPALDAFSNEIGKGRLQGFVYIDADEPLPFALPHKHGAATFEEHPIGDILGELGFSIDPKAFVHETSVKLRAVLYLMEAYFDRSRSEINQKLRRRLHWLAG